LVAQQQQQQHHHNHQQQSYAAGPTQYAARRDSPPLSDVASAYEQRQAAKHQIEANLRARSGGRPSTDAPSRDQGYPPSAMPLVTAHGSAPLHSPPIPLSSSPGRSSDTHKSNSPIATSYSNKIDGPAPWRKREGPAVSSSASSGSSPTPSLRGVPTAEKRSPTAPSDISNRAQSPDRNVMSNPSSLGGRSSPSHPVLRNARAPSPLPSSLSRYQPEPSYSGTTTPTFSVVVIRQPRGPPAGADELGSHNFATRIRQKAALDLSTAIGRRSGTAATGV
jgi:hypothetical protein